MLMSPLEALSESTLRQLCVDKYEESDTLDFKQAIPDSSEPQKRELLKDVCAFANASGGDLLYGIKEHNGAAFDLLPISSEMADAAKLRLSQTVDAGIEPRITGIRIHPIMITGGFALVIRVPASYDGPHCIRKDSQRRFVIRNGTGTSDMTFDQIRGAFDRTATLAERARQFTEVRLDRILERKTWRPLLDAPIAAGVFVPLSGLSGRHNIDIANLNTNMTPLMFRDWTTGASRTMNLDGIVAYAPVGQEVIAAYTQVFRNGSMEMVRYAGVRDDPKKRFIPSTVVSDFLRETVIKFIASAKRFGISGPAIATFALLKVEGYEFGAGNTFSMMNRAFSDRPDLILPERWIADIDSVNPDDIARPVLDILWQSFDVERCFLYDEHGNWNPGQR